jgi:hypothetical protein
MLPLIERISEQCARPATRLKHPAQDLPQPLPQVMRGFGRPCRGHGQVLVTLVRQTAQHLLDLGGGIATWSQEAKALLHQDPHLRAAQRQRLWCDLEAASDAPRQSAKQAQRLTQGTKLGQCKSVHAYAPTSAPIIKGKSNCPAQFGRQIGLLSEPAAGFIFAHRVPKGNPRDPSSVVPRLDKGHQAIDLVTSPTRWQSHSLGGALGGNDAALRHALHARGILPGGIPTTGEPSKQVPSPEDVRDIRNGSGLHRIRPPHHVHLACASGYSRPVVESHIATLMARGADHVRDQGLEGAVGQIGMTVIAHNGAVLVRICQHRLSKRGQKFRRLLGLKQYKINQINDSQN